MFNDSSSLACGVDAPSSTREATSTLTSEVAKKGDGGERPALISARPVQPQFHGWLNLGADELENAMASDPGLKTPRAAMILYKWLFMKDPAPDLAWPWCRRIDIGAVRIVTQERV